MNSPLSRWVARFTAIGLALASGAVATAVAASPASAAVCPARSLSQPYSGFGDYNNYFLAPSGTFEGGASGWTTSSARVVSGSEPWAVHGAGLRSLRVDAAGYAKSPVMCIATAEDSMRFFYRSPGVAGSGLQVFIEVTSGANYATNQYTVDGTAAGWRVSERIMLPDIRDASGTQYVTITFRPVNNPAAWQVDDVDIDPWRTR